MTDIWTARKRFDPGRGEVRGNVAFAKAKEATHTLVRENAAGGKAVHGCARDAERLRDLARGDQVGRDRVGALLGADACWCWCHKLSGDGSGTPGPGSNAPFTRRVSARTVPFVATIAEGRPSTSAYDAHHAERLGDIQTRIPANVAGDMAAVDNLGLEVPVPRRQSRPPPLTVLTKPMYLQAA